MEFYKEIILKNGEILVIRTPKIEDAEEFANCFNQIKKETKFLTIGEEDEDYTIESEIKFIQGFQNSTTNVCLIALYNGKNVGNTSIISIGKHSRSKHRVSFGICILKEFWGKGVAGKLMSEIINIAKDLGYEQIELGVVENNISAYNLYKSFGFKEQGIKEKALKYADGTYANEIFMTKFLKEKSDRSHVVL